MTQPPVGVPTCYRHPDRETYIRCQRCERPICPDCMHEAAVGHQCPSCVAEGRRETRAGQAAYGGGRSANPSLTSIVLIGLNAAVWVAIFVTGRGTSWLIDRLALTPVGVCGSASQPDRYYSNALSERGCEIAGADGVWHPGVADGAVWQLLSNAFAHVEIWHIAVNMLVLWFFGPQLERLLGRTRFLALYLISALAGSVCVYWLTGENIQTLGASGAIFGMLGAMIVIAIKVGGDFQQLLMWLGINVVITFVVPNVSWQGHLGGLLGGATVASILVFAPRQRRTVVQAAGLAALVTALAAATVVRTILLA